jgi:oligopeptide/dipeptide ABC transporter ATP-binding protein
MSDETILSIRNLCTYIETGRGLVRCVDGIDLDVKRGETLGLVGESGCGKTITALSIMGMVKKFPGVVAGEMCFRPSLDETAIDLISPLKYAVRTSRSERNDKIIDIEKDVLAWDKQIKNIYEPVRGRRIAMVFQDPQTSLNPYWTVGKQIGEAVRIGWRKKNVKNSEADQFIKREVQNWLERVHIDRPKQVVNYYPHELSGGMCQRIMIAIAMASEPDLIIADEPTTGLDVTIQAHIVDLFLKIKKEINTTVILISHDMGLIGRLADRIAVMYCGKIIEVGDKKDLFYESNYKIDRVGGIKSPMVSDVADMRHPYTAALLQTRSYDKMKLNANKRLPVIEEEVPDPLAAPEGCAFHPRCNVFKHKTKSHLPCCQTTNPPRTYIDDSHWVNCWDRDSLVNSIEK